MTSAAPWVMVVAGEASGDRHAADVVRELKARRPDLRFFGMGGTHLGAAGSALIHPSSEISVMGISEVLPKIPRILRVLADLVRVAEERRPICAILVDVPDFNLRLAKKLKRLGVPVIWYISPMVWAWRASRTRVLQRVTEKILCILPFEPAFLNERGCKAVYVGNPLVDQLPARADKRAFRAKLELELSDDAPVLAMLPGSRRSEIAKLFPTMLATARKQREQHPGLRVVVPVAPGLDLQGLRAHATAAGVDVTFVNERAAEVVGASDVALVASGTATLEAALMERPLVVIYRVSWLTYLVGRLLVRLPAFSLVNLLARKKIVPELLQREVTPERIHHELEALWAPEASVALQKEMAAVRTELGNARAAVRAAEEVLQVIGPRASSD